MGTSATASASEVVAASAGTAIETCVEVAADTSVEVANKAAGVSLGTKATLVVVNSGDAVKVSEGVKMGVAV